MKNNNDINIISQAHKAYRYTGAVLVGLGVLLGFFAAGAMDGGGDTWLITGLIVAAVGVLLGGVACVKAASEIEVLEGELDYIYEKLGGERDADF